MWSTILRGDSGKYLAAQSAGGGALNGEEAGDGFESGVGESEVAAEVGTVEEPAGEDEEEMHVRGAIGGKFGAFEEDGGAGDVGLGMTAGPAGPINDDGAARGKEDVVRMKIGVANGRSSRKECERGFGSAALFGGEVVGASEPVVELLALRREFWRRGELVHLRVKIGEEVRRVEQLPWLALDELEERGSFDAFQDDSGSGIDLD